MLVYCLLVILESKSISNKNGPIVLGRSTMCKLAAPRQSEYNSINSSFLSSGILNFPPGFANIVCV